MAVVRLSRMEVTRNRPGGGSGQWRGVCKHGAALGRREPVGGVIRGVRGGDAVRAGVGDLLEFDPCVTQYVVVAGRGNRGEAGGRTKAGGAASRRS